MDDNLIIKRLNNIVDILYDFFPKDVAKLISNYDYYLEGKIVHSLNGHIDQVTCIAMLPDGRIVSGSDDGTLKIWNRKTGKCDITCKDDNYGIMCITVLADGRIVSGSRDGTLKVWNSHILSLGKDNDERQRNHQTEKCDITCRGHTDEIWCVAVLPDGNIISGSEDARLKIWNPETGECYKTFIGHTDGVNCVAVLPDGDIVSGSHDNTLKTWNPGTGKCEITFTGHSDSVTCIGVLPDKRIVSGSLDATLKIWNYQTGKCEITFTGHTGTPNPKSFGFGVALSQESEMKVPLGYLNASDRTIECVAVLPDERIVCGYWDNTLKIWNHQTGECDIILKGHNCWINCVAVLPDGRIVSGSNDRALKIWS
jgi:WD40 repeat protein